MPDTATTAELKSDPTVLKQFDRETPLSEQIQDLYHILDDNNFCLLNTKRSGTGPVGRLMGLARRHGPDLLFLANKYSKKIEDIGQESTVQCCFHDSKSQNWASVTGIATVHLNDGSDSRVQELYTPTLKAWFGDLGDSIHDGSKSDPRIVLIEVKASYIVYWKSEVGKIGFAKEVGGAVMKGQVANTGSLREMGKGDVEKMRTDG